MKSSGWLSRSRRLAGLTCLAAAEILLSGASALAQEPPPDGREEVVLTVPQAPAAPAPAAPAPDAAKKAEKPPEPPPPFWSTIPPIKPLPRPGAFLLPPQGEGYYSLKDYLDGNFREKRPIQPYGPITFTQQSFFDTTFGYLDKPDNKQTDFFDPLKRIHCDDCWMLSLGGEIRTRYAHEESSRLTGRTNDYTLYRTRLFADLWYGDLFRVFVEGIDAHSFGEELNPLIIDENRADLLNAFVDVKVAECDDRPVTLRIGRQELLYGSQRLISTLDWANNRRTFQGVKAFYQGKKHDLDLFWVQPIVFNDARFDSVDNDQNFSGIWYTGRPKQGHVVDLYYLNLDQARAVAQGRYGARGGFNVHTIGARHHGNEKDFLWDFEGMYQFGEWVNQKISAGAATAALGYQFSKHDWKPQFWVGYDYASGERDPRQNETHGTFNQLFPFGHYYHGFIDVVARQNIHDVNAQVAFFPAKWITVVGQYHNFRLDKPKDALYNAAGAAIRRDPTGRAGRDVGDEIDVIVNFHLTQHQDLLLGWSKLFPGEFIDRTGSGREPEYFYMQYSFKW